MRFVLFSAVMFFTAHVSAQESVLLADANKARFPIVVEATASDGVKKSAQALADYLEKISGAKFAIETGDGKTGIALGLDPQLISKDPTQQERYRIRTHAQGMTLHGASDLAVQHAVWDVLYRLGHRQFFPGPTWEVIPKKEKIELALDLNEQPAYWSRSIWYGYGTWDYNGDHYKDWNAKNRMGRGIELYSGHAYDGIRHRNEKVFEEHPEYLGLWKGERKSNQFCISNPDMRKVAVEDALRQIGLKPERQSISMEPADGSAWCQCDKCAKLGSISDRAVTLANQVSEALTQKFGDRFVGMYAYNEHSPPPSIPVHPKVIVSVATAFVRGGFTVDQLMAGWKKQGATIGIREYYSVQTWDRDLPGAARGSNLAYLRRTIPHFHGLGARFLSAESSDNWGPNGLGYYLSSRMLWNVAEAERVDALVEDFYEKAFGPAKEPMRQFYRLIDGANRPLLCDDLLGRMFRHLDEAKKKTTDPKIHERLHDLLLYTRYVEMFSDYYSTAVGAERQERFEKLIKHTYRMRKTMMVHAKATYRDLDNRDKSVTIPPEAIWSVPEKKNPWKSSEPFSDVELKEILAKGIATRPLLAFTPVSFSTKLVPATPLNLPERKDGTMGIYHRGTNQFWTWLEQPGAVQFQAKSGIIYGNQGDGKYTFFPSLEPEGKAVAEVKTPPDKEFKDLEMKSTFPGLHKIEAAGGGGMNITFPREIPITVQSSPEQPFHFYGRWWMYFYVPRGTKIVGGFSSGFGSLRDGNDKEVFKFDKQPNYWSVPVPEGQDGKLWKFENCVGARHLMTVPPYLARHPRDLLLPEEVVQRDRK